MKVEVLLYARIDGKPPGQIVVYDDGPHVRRLLASGKVDLVNPPDLLETKNGTSEHLPSPTPAVHERSEPAPPAGSGEESPKRTRRRNPERPSGQVGEIGLGPPSGPVEELSDDWVHDGSREESS